ncbi:lysine N(6)-hydroxylase/L-ornithine N(5)-oxygenase family protein [Streptomyces sp. 4N509B]|uniref:lysine N(6)-hydroxylase/L-ornithine N(5)-oxygenase family protein n=1 Tax=Streptomyces sp. 4N509B TaxID=3457413 RepID=UPI003FD6A0DC
MHRDPDTVDSDAVDSDAVDSDAVHDVLGLGFGPSNLALAVAVEEHNRRLPDGARPLSAGFLEMQPRFGWHRGMLLEDATMQVSFLKDLVTLRNPTSDFSFVNYLHEKGRLVDFLNQKTFFPLRIEFHDYFEWAAARLAHLVEYGAEVLAVEPVTGPDGRIALLDVTSRDPRHPDDPSRTVTRRARNVVLATGLEPHLPPGTVLSRRVLHTSQLLTHTSPEQPVRRAVVVGAGQSAAEAVDHLHRTYPQAEICSVFGKYGFTPADDSPLANRIFDPEAVDLFYDAPSGVKRSLLDYHRSTNYSVVDMDLIESLSATLYRERVQGRQRLRMLNVSRVRDVTEDPATGLTVTVEALATGEREVLDAELLVYATGYRPRDPAALLGDVAKLCLRDEEDAVRVGRDHRVVTADHLTAGVYLQGATEHTHGLTATLLSHTAVRAGEVLDSLLAHAPASRPAHPTAV